MQKVSIKKISILGLVLLAASAVTAAVLPSNNSDKPACNGSADASTNPEGANDFTCSFAASAQSCFTETDPAGTPGSTSGTGNGVTAAADTRDDAC